MNLEEHIDTLQAHFEEFNLGVISLQQLHIEVIALREMIDSELESRAEEVMKSE